MNNQKLNYRKILTTERLPHKYQILFVIDQKGVNKTTEFSQKTNEETFRLNYKYWLEPFESREEELADLLEHAINLLDTIETPVNLHCTIANIYMNAQNLIWKIKNNAPKLMDDE